MVSFTQTEQNYSYKKVKMPVNLPYFWKVIIKSPTSISGFLDGGNTLLNDLFFSITNYYADSELKKCNLYNKYLYRIISLKKYNDFDSLEQWKQDFLKQEGFIYCEDPEIGTFSCKLKDRIKDIATISDSLYTPKIILSSDINFTIVDDKLIFNFNILEGDSAFNWNPEEYITPWGDKTIIYTTNLIASSVTSKESPLWENYGVLVYDKEFDENIETEEEYRNKILALYLMYYNGPKESILTSGLNIYFGIPVTLDDKETIIKITNTEITTNKNIYTLIPSVPINENISVGATLKKYTPLQSAIKIIDHDTNPNYIFGRELPDELYKIPSGDLFTKTITNDDYVFNYDYNLQDNGIAIKYDIYDVKPFYKNENDLYPYVKSSNFYIYHTYFKNSICFVEVNNTIKNLYPNIEQIIKKILYEIGPLNSYFIFV